MAKKSDSVSKQTMYIAAGVALLVGFMGGVIFSSLKSDTYYAPQTTGAPAPPGGVQQPGLSPQQASTILGLEQRVSANPADAEAWVQLGNTYFDASLFSKAIRAYSKYDELRPGNANVLTDLGVMFRRNGQSQQAIEAFNKAIAANPRHEQSRFNLGIVYMYDMQDIANAVKTWEGLLQVNPGAVAGNGTPISQLISDAKAQLPTAQ